MKRIISVLIIFAIAFGLIVPIKASAKSKEKIVSVAGIVAPISSNWEEQYSDAGSLLYEIPGQKEGTGTSVWILSESVNSDDDIKKAAKVLSKKNSKSKVLKTLFSSEALLDSSLTKKNLKLKKDPAGKYMAVIDYKREDSSNYIVIRNIDDRYLTMYAIISDTSISSKLKKTVLGYAKRIEADPLGSYITLMDEITVPFDDSWTLVLNYDDEGRLFTDIGFTVYIYADYAKDKKVATLLQDISNKEELKNHLMDSFNIRVEDIDKSIRDKMFVMEPDGQGSYYAAIYTGEGYVVFRVIDDKYVVMAEVMKGYMEVDLDEKTIEAVKQLILEAYIR